MHEQCEQLIRLELTLFLVDLRTSCGAHAGGTHAWTMHAYAIIDRCRIVCVDATLLFAGEQAVDLTKQLSACGVSEAAAVQYLDSAPSLAFSVYYGGRSDCGAEAQARSADR